MTRWTRLFAFALGWAPAVVQAFPVTVLEQNGPVDRRFNIAVLGDGYTSADQAKLTSDARTVMDDFFDAPPYSMYRGLFNIKLIQAVSNQSGADNGAAGGMVDTVFDAAFNCDGLGRLLCVDERAVLTAAARDVPEFNLALVIVNDTKYGGSGGDVPSASTNRQSAEILRHELAHNLANLADEYESAFPGYDPCPPARDCPEPNVTLKRTRAEIKWLDWILPTTPIPTTEGAGITGIGIFEGARYLTSGVYRPVESMCKMRTLSRAFCSVCVEALVRAFWNLPNVHLIDQVTPAGAVQNDRCEAVTFAVTTPTLTPPTLTFAWTIDGQPQSTTTSSFAIAAGTLGNGRHEVEVIVKDPTTLVRRDPQGALQDQHVWTLTLAGCGGGDASLPPIEGGSIDAALDVGGGDSEVGPPSASDAARPDGIGGMAGGGGSGPDGAGGTAGMGGGTGAGGAGGTGTGGGAGTGKGGTGPGGSGGFSGSGGSGIAGSMNKDGGQRAEDAGSSADTGGPARPRSSPVDDPAGCACRLAMGGDRDRHAALAGWALACALSRALTRIRRNRREAAAPNRPSLVRQKR